MAKALQQGEGYNGYEILIECPNGQRLAALAHANPIHDESGKLLGAVNVLVDLSEQKRAEEERRRLDAKIQHAQKLASLGVLAGGIAHEFNNLLTCVLGYASLALAELPAESAVSPMLREIEKAGKRAADLAGQMLAYSGRGRFVVGPFRLDALLEEMATLMTNVVAKNATLHFDLAPVTIDGDAAQFRQVILNLISNSSEALEGRRGTIHVRAGVRHVDADFLRASCPGLSHSGELRLHGSRG